MTIEERIKRARDNLGLTQRETALAIGISPATLCRAEAGSLRLAGRNRDKAEQWLKAAKQEGADMANRIDLSAVGRVDGMGNRDDAGAYLELVAIKPNGTREVMTISEGNATTFLAELRGLIEPQGLDSGPALPKPAPEGLDRDGKPITHRRTREWGVVGRCDVYGKPSPDGGYVKVRCVDCGTMREEQHQLSRGEAAALGFELRNASDLRPDTLPTPGEAAMRVHGDAPPRPMIRPVVSRGNSVIDVRAHDVSTGEILIWRFESNGAESLLRQLAATTDAATAREIERLAARSPGSLTGEPDAIEREAKALKGSSGPSIEADGKIVAELLAVCEHANDLVTKARAMGLDVRLPTVGQQPFRVMYAGRPYVDQSREALEGKGPISTAQLALGTRAPKPQEEG